MPIKTGALDHGNGHGLTLDVVAGNRRIRHAVQIGYSEHFGPFTIAETNAAKAVLLDWIVLVLDDEAYQAANTIAAKHAPLHAATAVDTEAHNSTRRHPLRT